MDKVAMADVCISKPPVNVAFTLNSMSSRAVGVVSKLN